MVTGAVVNGNRTRAGWASYFLDHASQLPTRPSGAFVGPPGHASYLTEDVRGCGGFPEDMRAGEDTVVNQKLFHDGRRTYYRSGASFHHASPARSLGQLCSHHFKRGRALGRIIRGGRTRWQSLLQLPVTASLPGRRLRALRAGMAFADADLRRRYRSLLPLVVSGALASTAGTAYELATGTASDADDEPRRPTARSSRDGPIFAIGGRPGEAACGLLSAGSATQAAQRLTTLTGYANHRTRVVRALAPIVTSATLTYEQHGTHVVHTWSESVRSHLNAARSVSGALILQVQPGAATLCDLVAIWAEFLDQPDVGLLIDLRPQVTFCHQGDQLEEVIDRLGIGVDPEAHPVKQTLLTRGLVSGQLPEHAAAADFVDLRQPGTKYPHDLFDTGEVPDAVIYQ